MAVQSRTQNDVVRDSTSTTDRREHGWLPRAGSLLTGRFGPYLALSGVLLVLVVYMASTNPFFLTWANATNLMRGSASMIVLASAMTLVVITAGVDLSIGALVGISSLIFAQLLIWDVPGVLAVVAVLACSGLLGWLCNGILIGRAGISFFVVTLGTMSFFRGVALLWNDKSIDMYSSDVARVLGDTALLGGRIPVGFLVALGVALLLGAVMRFTRFGRSVFAVGGNREAAELSGIPSGWVVAAVYGISGVACGLAAVMLIGRTTVAQATAGTGIELQVIAVVLLGGAALSGGVGTIWGTLLGVAFLQVLSNALDLSGLSSYWQMILTGVILVVAVTLDAVRSRRFELSRLRRRGSLAADDDALTT
jgi:ribose/xylose/arabinose/galactoside ABC-type transport system permease subunit